MARKKLGEGGELRDRCYNVRVALGFGGSRDMSKFARDVLKLRPASVHNIESGKTRKLGGKAWQAYIKAGANPEYLMTNLGLPVLRETKKLRRVQEMLARILYFEADQLDAIEAVIRTCEKANAAAAEGQRVIREARENQMKTGDEDEPAIASRDSEGGDPKGAKSGGKDAQGRKAGKASKGTGRSTGKVKGKT